MPDMSPVAVDALIAENVRAARARRRMRQDDLADEMRRSRQTISAIEAGTRRVTIADAISLCTVLEIDLAELLRGAPAEVLRILGLREA